MKTKKTVFAVLAAVLLISAALIVSCIDPLEEITAKPKTSGAAEAAGAEGVAGAVDVVEVDDIINFPIPAGKGVVKFKISDSSARTIMPELPNLSTMLYTIEFVTATNPGTNNKTLTRVGATTANAAITLNAVTYTSVHITAYDAADISGAHPVAGWNNSLDTTYATGVPITNGGSVAINANLIAFKGTDNGKFHYNITIPSDTYTSKSLAIYDPSDLTTALDLTDFDGGNPSLNPIDITASGAVQSADITLLSGYYTIILTVAKTDYQTRQYVRAVHIYPEMTSIFTQVVPALTQIKNFTVTFNLGTISSVAVVDDTVPNGGSGNNYIQSKDYIAKLSPYGNTPIAVNFPTYTFGAWYKESALTNLWNFASDMILGNTTLYASWNAPGTTGTVTFTVTFDYADILSGALTGKSITRGTFNEGSFFSLTLGVAPDGGDWNNVKWHVANPGDSGNEIDFTSSTFSPSITNSGKTLTINNSSAYAALLAQSDFEITLTVDLEDCDDSNNDGSYSCTVTITVNP